MDNVETRCDKCGEPIQLGEWPFCPHGIPMGGIIGDDIPGGVLIKHGICNPDGSPKRYYSKTEIKQAAFEKGLTHGYDTPKPNPRLEDARAAARELKG